MKKRISFLLVFLMSYGIFAQENSWFYATMHPENAQILKTNNPDGIQILETNGNQSAVYVSEEVAHQLHGNFIIHGPGFVYKKSKEEALAFIHQEFNRAHNVMDFTITEDAFVLECLDLVDPENIEETILMLEDFGTRYHLRDEAIQSIYAIQAKWQALADAANRTDVSFEIVEHVGTPMPSLIMTIEGAEQADEYVIIGGHADSITPFADDAPGADDNASGIATITEVLRVLLDQGYKPQRTVQFMAYAAEEVGLVGSDEIAQTYFDEGINVVAYVQFDMTNYKGSTADIAIIQDSYTSGDLNIFLIELLEHYNNNGSHAISYTDSQCNYGCSDHASWKSRGYLASFPFEAKFGEHNPQIHTPGDLYSLSGNSNHAAKFTKLGLEFIIEVAKRSSLSTFEIFKSELNLVVNNKELIYEIKNSDSRVHTLEIIDTSARRVLSQSNLGNSGKVNIGSLASGVYVAAFKDGQGQSIVKKFLVK